MTETFNIIFQFVTFILSGVAVYFSLRKQKHDERNLDADTIGKLLKSIKDLTEDNENLKARIEKSEKENQQRFAVLSMENVKLRSWARRLIAQLEHAQIVPCKLEE